MKGYSNIARASLASSPEKEPTAPSSSRRREDQDLDSRPTLIEQIKGELNSLRPRELLHIIEHFLLCLYENADWKACRAQIERFLAKHPSGDEAGLDPNRARLPGAACVAA